MPFSIGPKAHNVIPKELSTLIRKFFGLRDWKGLYLTGGTCLAEYYFGHRLSEDMDLFMKDKTLFEDTKPYFLDPSAFPEGTMRSLRATDYICQYEYQPRSEHPPIKVDVVLDMAPRIGDSVSVDGVWINNLDDILSSKMGCLISRNEPKDYLDLFRLIPASHLTTRELIKLGLVKEGGLDPLIIAHQMEFIFKSPPPRPELLGTADWTELQIFFGKLQKECLDLIRPSSP
jgi:nucleotidyltransferase AbiEii toxin of type IV toxin-antitoxin system